MAYTEDASLVSVVAGATFSTSDLYKGVVLDSSGHAVLPNTTGDVIGYGSLYGRTSTTSAAGSQAVPVAVGGVVKLQMAASTLSAGNPVALSTAGLGIAPTTDSHRVGVIKTGSSGGAGRVVSVQWTGSAGLGV